MLPQQNYSNELNTEKDKLTHKNEEVKKLNPKIDKLKEEIKNIESQLSKLKEEKKLNVNKLKEINKSLKDKKNKKNNSKNKTLKSQQEKEKLKINTELNQITELINRLERKLKEIQKDEENISKKEDLFLREIKNIENQCSKIEKEISNKEDENKKLDILRNERMTLYKTQFPKEKTNVFFYKINKIELSKSNNKIWPVSFELKPINESNSKNEFWLVSENNIGLITKLKRYKFSIDNAIKGYIRNPLMISSLLKFPTISRIKHLEEDIKTKWALNKAQENSVRKMISTNNTFYLQGPPGTGKTQTICATIQHFIKENANVLITSSTHEAITNCLERFDEHNKNDPNIIIYKKCRTREEDKNEKFGVCSLYKNFLKKIKNNILGIDNQQLGLDDIEKNIKELHQCFPENSNIQYIPPKIFNDLYTGSDHSKKLANEKFKDLIFEKELFNMDNFKENEDASLEEVENYGWYSSWFKIDKFDKSYISKFQTSSHLKNLLEQLFKTKNLIFVSVKGIEKYLKDCKKSYSKDKLFDNFKTIEKLNEEASLSFKKYINENNLINLLGYTTSSNTKLEIEGDLQKDIWFDYPIDTIIMDEVSKSSTPEILSRINISHKFIMCGDYKQLPPAIEFGDSDLLKNIYKNAKDRIFNNKEKNNLATMLNLNEEETTEEKFEDAINNLFSTPIFKNQIAEIKKQGNIKSSIYSFLNEQYRFNEIITKLVNNFYDEREKLTCKKDDSLFEKYYFFDNDNEQKVFFIDTTELPATYKNRIKIDLKNDDSFDQTEIIKEFEEFQDFSRNLSSLFNQYNAYIDLKIVNQLVTKNKSKDLENKIGIICLTTSQKHIVRHLLNKYNDLKHLKIKVDTIDNFQGREKEIIIVDFVRAKNKLTPSKLSITEKRNISFLAEEERINVAASRAKNLLFLVGSFEYYLSIQNDFNSKRLLIKYIEHANENPVGVQKIEGKKLYDKS